MCRAAWRFGFKLAYPPNAPIRLTLTHCKILGTSPRLLIWVVRQHNEFQSGHFQYSLDIELGEFTDHLDGLTKELPLVVLCAFGMRATIACSILWWDGRNNIRVL